MNTTYQDKLIKQAYTVTSIRQNIINTGQISLYCDYAGFASLNKYGVACCLVHNRSISVTAKQLHNTEDFGSIYGELQAIAFSLELLAQALQQQQPKIAVIYTDCSTIDLILAKDYFADLRCQTLRDEIQQTIQELKLSRPEVTVIIRYISRHKKNNALHQMAHHAARASIR
ncbi:hypothetical protein GOM71_09435 [Paenibacillus sp. NEAU-GSW1]|nr:hypothetical protein [Paenibacillus sp. NEAU-GSW1]MUT66150.1 hypothetical protein [Paenibacillus sp. NEAU-GSW1]